MSTREMLYQDIAVLTDEQVEKLAEFVRSIKQSSHSETKKSARGIFHDVANPEMIPLEKKAWEEAAVEKHIKALEEMNSENS